MLTLGKTSHTPGVRLCLSAHQGLLKLGISLCASQVRKLAREPSSSPYACTYNPYERHSRLCKSNSGYSDIHAVISQRPAHYTSYNKTANISLVGCICSVMHKQHLLPSQSTRHRSPREDCRSESLLNVPHQVSTC